MKFEEIQGAPKLAKIDLKKVVVNDQLFCILTFKGMMPLNPLAIRELSDAFSFLETIEEPLICITTCDNPRTYCPGLDLKY